MSARPAIVRTTQASELQRVVGICARRVVDVRSQCAAWTEVAERHEPLASLSVERRYDHRRTVYAHIVNREYNVTYSSMRAKVATYAHA